MYEETARFYDEIYAWRNYERDAARLGELIAEHAPHASTLLDVACGTGRHLEFLRSQFAVEGVDFSKEMLKVAHTRLGNVPLHAADMRNFALGKRFDVVMCLFGSIALVRSLDEAHVAARNLVAHTQPGGVVIVEPWIKEHEFEDQRVEVGIQELADGKMATAAASHKDGRVGHLDMHYLIATTRGVEHFAESLDVGLWTEADYISLLEDEGLQGTYDKDGLMGRGLVVGIHP